MHEIERLETIIVKLNDRLTIQEKEVFHLKTKVETNETTDKVRNLFWSLTSTLINLILICFIKLVK